jgi:hypothetical protein
MFAPIRTLRRRRTNPRPDESIDQKLTHYLFAS